MSLFLSESTDKNFTSSPSYDFDRDICQERSQKKSLDNSTDVKKNQKRELVVGISEHHLHSYHTQMRRYPILY